MRARLLSVSQLPVDRGRFSLVARFAVPDGATPAEARAVSGQQLLTIIAGTLGTPPPVMVDALAAHLAAGGDPADHVEVARAYLRAALAPNAAGWPVAARAP